MDHAFDGAEDVVADRIAALFGPPLELARVGNELPRDRIVRIVAVDQVGHSRSDGDGITRGDLGKRAEPLARRQSVVAKLVEAVQAGCWRCHGSGFHKT